MLRVLFVAAPEHQTGKVGDASLTSADPFSLYQAGREAARLADAGSGAWGESNWCGGRAQRAGHFLLMRNLDKDLPLFIAALERERPNLLLLGAMTLCLPGAIRCAEVAREILGDRIAIVLGGRHAGETIYRSATGKVVHHPGSPVRLEATGKIPQLFDIVISGEGEYIVAALGELVARLEAKRRPASALISGIEALAFTVPGEWIASWSSHGSITNVQGHAGPIDRDHLIHAGPARLFGVHTKFDTFGGRPTAHVMSDSGSGCVYNCQFCSERRAASGVPAQRATSATRLLHHMAEINEVVASDYAGCRASAFIEDSTLLAGRRESLFSFTTAMAGLDFDMRFGAQMTIDQVLQNRDLLRPLRLAGMTYLFVGLETVDTLLAQCMSKNIARAGEWADRASQAFELLAAHDIKWGTALLFGMGEGRGSRNQMFRHLENWRRRYGSPCPISMNWAVQHPLRGEDCGASYQYDQWGTEAGPLLDEFLSFGEASERYPLVGVAPPHLEEVREVTAMFRSLPVPSA